MRVLFCFDIRSFTSFYLSLLLNRSKPLCSWRKVRVCKCITNRQADVVGSGTAQRNEEAEAIIDWANFGTRSRGNRTQNQRVGSVDPHGSPSWVLKSRAVYASLTMSISLSSDPVRTPNIPVFHITPFLEDLMPWKSRDKTAFGGRQGGVVNTSANMLGRLKQIYGGKEWPKARKR